MGGSEQRAQSGAARGAAADAIAGAEVALAHQNSMSSQLDLQVIAAILNAHLTAVDGSEALDELQQETEAAVRTRSDLDTPAGARDFQRFLIGKLRDIREVVATASLDDTSKATLMAAWTSLYNASKQEASSPGDAPTVTEPAAGTGADADRAAGLISGDPLLDSLLFDDPGLVAEAPLPQGAAPSGAATAPALPSMPGLGDGSGAATPSGAGSVPNLPAGPALSAIPRAIASRLDELDDPSLDSLALDPDDSDDEPADLDEDTDGGGEDTEQPASSGEPQPLPTGSTKVTLPNGDTITAASPELAAAINATAGGAAIADAFQQQGIAIPPPGTPVSDPIDPARLAAGDIGMFTDRHALALGDGHVFLDGQMQQVSSMGGPNFLGWQHPPTSTTVTAPAQTGAPTPTRPATTPVAPRY
ncbi:hypothetical protein NJB1907f44_34500 [Mycobacterium marinum]|uniref:DUF4226 domain-containing protein n=1 Tax=Mycobacterium marinum TaxID=1781 RepID=UPI000E3E15F8|nr:DUF4226 domain-containing protein [Mycobacterium marinum]RFZ44031.1 Biofilm regulator BssS [Mycobacterium marinum]GJN96098.1 hypothetical protein NJB1907f34b_03510 [Mycobacterium marinum]GJO04427.1 hypothetical protein NJB1907E90_12560 [Mycobacterium marinum]GJO12115.1 hypothetical protein NJB1907E11_05050 [Mycobacterium marinum]GJO23288.1 hypothetical protein NJB1907f22_07320 [Mycobacterium marinum]